MRRIAPLPMVCPRPARSKGQYLVELAPIVQVYVERLEERLLAKGMRKRLYVMRSDGGMAAATHVAARPAAIIESGPASGAIAAAALGRRLGTTRLLSFDMGGTTAKAGAIVDGVAQVAAEFEAAGSTHSGRSVKGSGYPVRFPFVDLAEVSAGGGTIAWIDDAGSLRVGPLSAGANPGPACYGTSARATVAPKGRPLAIPFATAKMSGVTPKCSAAQTLPVRPTPDCTSSRTSRIPNRSQIRRSSSKNFTGGA